MKYAKPILASMAFTLFLACGGSKDTPPPIPPAPETSAHDILKIKDGIDGVNVAFNHAQQDCPASEGPKLATLYQFAGASGGGMPPALLFQAMNNQGGSSAKCQNDIRDMIALFATISTSQGPYANYPGAQNWFQQSRVLPLINYIGQSAGITNTQQLTSLISNPAAAQALGQYINKFISTATPQYAGSILGQIPAFY